MPPTRTSRSRRQPVEIPADGTNITGERLAEPVAVNDDHGNPMSPLDFKPRQPSSTPPDGPLTRRVSGESYVDYLFASAAVGCEPLDQETWSELPIS